MATTKLGAIALVVLFLCLSSQYQTALAEYSGATLQLHLGNFTNHNVSNQLVEMRTYKRQYFVRLCVSRGKEEQVQELLVDTGSGITWMQSSHCVDCFAQTSDKLDPNRSSTMDAVSQMDDICKGPNLIRDDKGCLFSADKDDGATFQGYLYRDFITLPTTRAIPKRIIFGLSIRGTPPKMFDDGRIGGILGLNNDTLSFIGQVSQEFHSKFSICLDTTGGELRLGDDVPTVDDTFQHAALIDVHEYHPGLQSSYLLGLQGVSVNGRPLDLRDVGFTGGIVVNTGSEITTLAPQLHRVIMPIIDDHFQSQNYFQISNPLPGYEVCYTYAGHGQSIDATIPTLELHLFSGKFDKPVSMVFTDDRVANKNVMSMMICLELQKGEDDIDTTLGVPQLLGTDLVFDTYSRVLSYKQSKNCLA